ncbi:MAG: serine hydrolase domain-containing protein [Actinophytocola sp.]|uniref:serine hydrolase domain-containing protein n=1 Tax=Actinophytocola sp. TaxID=1872138 RepID=UPI003D6ABBA7
MILLAMLSVIAACSSPEPASTEVEAVASYDCGRIQGPLSTNSFYEDNPTYTDPVDDSASWTMSTPEAQYMDSSRLERASTALADLPYSWSFLVVRNGALVFERYYHGSAKNQSNNVHSASKSIWGAAIGIAIDQGRIDGADATIASVLPSRYDAAMNPETKTIKVRDLLTMTSGSRWTENTTETQLQHTPDWVAATLRLPRAATPGAVFNYSTGDSHLSSAVLTEATRTTACEFVHENLLAPMGVVAERWGRDPQGYFSGGYNFYATPRELAKFGLLYLDDGRWNGRQLVPADWVAASMADQVDAGAPFSYGYDFWLRDIAGHHVAMAWGFGGQMIYIVEDLDLVVVMTTNTRDFDQDSFTGLSVIEDDVLPAAG